MGGLWLDPSNPNNTPPYFAVNIADIVKSKGSNILAKWQHNLSKHSIISLQAYVDHFNRVEFYTDLHNDTFDAELTHQLRFASGNELIWGLNYRRVKDGFNNNFQIMFDPEERTTELFSLFAQFDMNITSNTRMIFGAKLEDNVYTGQEFQPNIRLMHKMDEKQSFWAAISRAARTPSRIEHSGRVITTVLPLPVPTPLYTFGNTDFKSEELTAYELGYRLQASNTLFHDVAAFYNEYQELGSIENLELFTFGEFIIPAVAEFDNQINANSWGIEMSATWRPKKWWKLQGNYTYLDVSARPSHLSNDNSFSRVYEGGSPRNQLSIISDFDINTQWSLNLSMFYVDELENSSLSSPMGQVSDYINLNLGLRWQLSEKFELGVFGQNLFTSNRPEFIAENYSIPSELEQTFFLRVRKSF